MTAPQPRVFLLDVEGTVAPISLVSEHLFPYARAHFFAFVQEKKADPVVVADLHLLAEENGAETDETVPKIANAGETGQVIAYLNGLMDRDRKSTALKSLQGKIWKTGFESGELKGILFADVPAALRRWSAKASVAIYSSGSVEAQRLVFRHSSFGDLTGLIAAYFDTRTGPKQASASYAAIAAAMNVEPGEVLFFSDAVQELDAAREAGCQTRLVVRPGNAPVEDAHGHTLVESFALL
ncbi:MAG TPA: acireductone synthase [Terracidiphilus sp.]|jgi:enolase-phosphatase E1